MPADISTSEAFVIERTTKTRAAQATLATDSGWTWPLKTLAQWDADQREQDEKGDMAAADVTEAADLLQGERTPVPLTLPAPQQPASR